MFADGTEAPGVPDGLAVDAEVLAGSVFTLEVDVPGLVSHRFKTPTYS